MMPIAALTADEDKWEQQGNAAHVSSMREWAPTGRMHLACGVFPFTSFNCRVKSPEFDAAVVA